MSISERRLVIALAYLLKYAPKEEVLDFDYDDLQLQNAISNASIILKCHDVPDFIPEGESTSIDETDGRNDVYINGVWHPELIAIKEAECVLSREETK